MTWRRFLAAFVLTPLMMAGSPTFLLASEVQGEAARSAARSAPASPLARPPLARGRQLPPSAVFGSTPERRAAWERLTPAQRHEAMQRFREWVSPALERTLAQQRQSPADGKAARRIPGLAAVAARALPAPDMGAQTAPVFARQEPPPAKAGADTASDATSGNDLDGDTLDDAFEAALADAFTPYYHVSAGEASGTGFARFGDYVPQTVTQNLPAVPPVSHYRVKPLGQSSIGGVPHSFVQVDYLTLWNRDDGLAVGGFCSASLSVLFGLIGLGTSLALDGAAAHALDNERSAVLVAAPLASAGNAGAYKSYDYYLAAHESTFFDHSIYLAPSQPMPAGSHVQLGLSRSKHATYEFNPDYFPLMPNWVIWTTYFTLDDLYWNCWIDYDTYLFYLYLADTVFFGCFVEHFSEQGGAYAGQRINVGEPGQPINGSSFIQTSQLYQKLTTPLWVIY